MAISFKTNDNYGFDIMKLLGVQHDLIVKAEAYGVLVGPQGPGKFTVTLDGKVYGTINVPGSAISLAKNGTLGPASKAALSAQFNSALSKALDNLKPEATTIKSKALDLSKAFPLPNLKPPVVGPQGQAPVKLANATHVLQPVTGTSPGSVYYTYLLLDGANVAVRVKGSKSISIRVEGPKIKKYSTAWDALDLDDNDSYYSGHFNVEDKGLMLKALGALAGVIGFTQIKASADPAAICSM